MRLLRLRLVYIAKSGRRTQTFQFLDRQRNPGCTALVEAEALRAPVDLAVTAQPRRSHTSSTARETDRKKSARRDRKSAAMGEPLKSLSSSGAGARAPPPTTRHAGELRGRQRRVDARAERGPLRNFYRGRRPREPDPPLPGPGSYQEPTTTTTRSSRRPKRSWPT